MFIVVIFCWSYFTESCFLKNFRVRIILFCTLSAAIGKCVSCYEKKKMHSVLVWLLGNHLRENGHSQLHRTWLRTMAHWRGGGPATHRRPRSCAFYVLLSLSSLSASTYEAKATSKGHTTSSGRSAGISELSTWEKGFMSAVTQKPKLNWLWWGIGFICQMD